MFYHGIKRKYVFRHYPILSPRRSVSSKNWMQLQDGRHLIEQFGLEPIHLLEDGADYPGDRCISECLAFGDTVFVFPTLPDPLWQLSQREVGVPTLDLRLASGIYTVGEREPLQALFPGIPVIAIRTPQGEEPFAHSANRL
ncbi:hypothetical protein ACI7RC_07640 [Brevibacillus sp. B_LB10_24]|uniref:hypothetical protein n=1 Tax=Brevibacillus sp. B_LB10_24 TaxID=3380645 RepID=UPI0038B786A1